MDGVEVLPEGATGVTAMLVLVVGLAALAFGQSWFWVVFAAGFGGLVPLVAILSKEEPEPEREAPTGEPAAERSEGDHSRTEALETLRDRYARGELTHEEFERKLEALMETETPESAAKRVERDREREEA